MPEWAKSSTRLIAHRLGVELTRREEQVLRLVVRAASNREIASALGIAPRTAKFHVSNLLRKFKAKKRTDLMLLWSINDD